MATQAERGQIFRALHHRDSAFLIPNPWDVGTARLLAHLGFEALATTSAGYAFSAGRLDNTTDRDKMMTHVSAVASSTDLPISADLGKGFGDEPEVAATVIELAAAAGLLGASIDDATGQAANSLYELSLATERVRAAAEVAHALPFSFI